MEDQEPKSLGSFPWHVTFAALTVVLVPLVWVGVDPGWVSLYERSGFTPTVIGMGLVLLVSFALSAAAWSAAVAGGRGRRTALLVTLLLCALDVALAWFVVASSRTGLGDG